MKRRIFLATAVAVLGIAGCTPAPPHYDIVVRGGTVYDGLGGEPFLGDVAIAGDKIAAVGDLGPATISDHATFPDPQQYATGVEQVFVNGVQVIENGEHTGATPGRVVRGPDWTGWSE